MEELLRRRRNAEQQVRSWKNPEARMKRISVHPGLTEIVLRKTTLLLSALSIAAFLFGATTAPPPAAQNKAQQKQKSAPKSAAKGASKKTVSKKGAGVTTAHRGTTARKPTVQSWRSTQRTPTPDRYKEIQQALASKGYLQPASPSGVWDTSSVEALKKFQQDQNLEPSGKLDSLSLIALGLGPKHDQAPPPPQP
jgi:hypothetical protein